MPSLKPRSPLIQLLSLTVAEIPGHQTKKESGNNNGCCLLRPDLVPANAPAMRFTCVTLFKFTANQEANYTGCLFSQVRNSPMKLNSLPKVIKLRADTAKIKSEVFQTPKVTFKARSYTLDPASR